MGCRGAFVYLYVRLRQSVFLDKQNSGSNLQVASAVLYMGLCLCLFHQNLDALVTHFHNGDAATFHVGADACLSAVADG